MKTAYYLVVLMLALLVLAVLAASSARDATLIQTHAREVRNKAANLPIEGFVIDRANRMRGRVVTSRGMPVGDVRIFVYDMDYFESCRLDLERPCPEATTMTGSDGTYEALNLAYGSKVVTFHKDGYAPAQAFEISFGDGYGARDVDGILTSMNDGVTVRFEQANATPAKGLALIWLSDVVDAPAFLAVTDADGTGCFTGPSHNRAAVLVGRPQYLIEFSTETPRIQLPDSSTLRLRCMNDNEANGEAIVTLLPASAKSTGAYTIRLRLDEGVLELPNVMHGTYSLVLRTELKAGLAEILHEGCEQEFKLASLGRRHVKVADRAGRPVSALVTWSATRRDDVAELWSLRHVLHDRDPTTIVVTTDADGNVELPALASAGGWLRIEAERMVTEVRQLAASTDSIEVRMDDGVPLYVKTQLPFLPVAIEEGLASPASYQRTGANAEAVFWTRPARVVVRSGFHRGALSLPRGGWPGEGQPAISMSLTDLAGPSNCLYGFVLDASGRGVPNADVYIQGPERLARSTKSEETGFFRYVGLKAGYHDIMARPVGMVDSVGISSEVVLHEGSWARSDLTIWPGRISGVTPEGTHTVRLQNDQGQTLWIASSDEESRYSFSCVPPGRYTVIALDEAGAPLEVTHFTVSNAQMGAPEAQR